MNLKKIKLIVPNSHNMFPHKEGSQSKDLEYHCTNKKQYLNSDKENKI